MKYFTLSLECWNSVHSPSICIPIYLLQRFVWGATRVRAGGECEEGGHLSWFPTWGGSCVPHSGLWWRWQGRGSTWYLRLHTTSKLLSEASKHATFILPLALLIYFVVGFLRKKSKVSQLKSDLSSLKQGSHEYIVFRQKWRIPNHSCWKEDLQRMVYISEYHSRAWLDLFCFALLRD